VPLAEPPVDNVIIIEDDVPLGDIPQTGTGEGIPFNLMLFGLSLIGLMGLLRRRSNEA